MKKAQQLRRTSQLRVEQLEGRLVPTVSLTASTNWSGYAVTAGNGSVTFVTGSWTVPTVSGTGTAYSSNWVGIDGFSSNTVEQIGTEQDVVNGKAQYSAWYEMYPNYPVTISGTVKPGDTITATVTANSTTSFTLTISDSSWTSTFSKTLNMPQGYKGALSSAEWIEEAPSSISGVLPLANFGTASFSNSKATISSISGNIDSFSSVYEINMVTKSGTAKDTTSALTDSSSGSSFTVTWKSSGASSGSGKHGRGGPVDLLTDTATTSSASASSVLASRAAGVLTTSNATTRSLPVASPLAPSFLGQLISSTGTPTPTPTAAARQSSVVAGDLLPSSGALTAGEDDPGGVPVTPNQDGSNPGHVPAGARPDGTNGVKPTPSDAAPSAEPGASLSPQASDSFFASEGAADHREGILSFDAREENVTAAVATSALMFGVAFGMTRRSTDQERRRTAWNGERCV